MCYKFDNKFDKLALKDVLIVISNMRMLVPKYSFRIELNTFEWNILNPDRSTNLEINNKRRTSII